MQGNDQFLRWAIFCTAFFAMFPTSPMQAQASEKMALQSDNAHLVFPSSAPGQWGLGLRLTAGGQAAAEFSQPAPLAVEVVDESGAATWLAGAYQSVSPSGNECVCAGRLQSANGTQFRVTDTYQALPNLGAFTLTRQVEILATSPQDKGFSSRFSLSPVMPTAMKNCEFFAPGIWYKNNAHVPPKALASHPDDGVFLFREDRLPLPVMMQRDTRSGVTLSLAHLGGVPTTFAGEDGLNRIIDARLGFGSLGIINTDNPSPVFQFPGTEGERTYIYGASLDGNHWAYRSHPISAGFSHRYRLLIQMGRTSDFPTAVRRAWQTVYDLQNPPIIKADLAKAYRDGIGLLDAYTRAYNGVTSVPFAATVPDGKVSDTSSQMGFVGEALPSAYLLLRDSLDTDNADAAARASAVLDFWASHSLTPSGVPKTWYDIHPDGTWTFRDYHTFLRVASDGADGMLQAWNVARQHGRDRPEWLAFCRRYGNWLVQAQNADGSYFREYGFDGLPIERSKDTTDQPIRFLSDLFLATGDERYKQAALRAGEFCLHSVHEAYAYVGGTPDNPNVMDKEAGMMALDAFLSLYDLMADKRWLTAAVQAAWYSETWVYAWNIPMPDGDPKMVFPKNRTTVGLSLIATGHSGSDTYMAAAPFLFYRLFLLTGEPHFREMARLLLYDTKQLLDWDGTLGYAYPGLQTEALSLPPRRGHGVTHWLPWLTVTQLEPLVSLKEVFGSYDIDSIEKLPLAERRRRNAQFSKTRGFVLKSIL